jgi:hypothetical protein
MTTSKEKILTHLEEPFFGNILTQKRFWKKLLKTQENAFSKIILNLLPIQKLIKA